MCGARENEARIYPPKRADLGIVKIRKKSER
jgi:hypothetical protein